MVAAERRGINKFLIECRSLDSINFRSSLRCHSLAGVMRGCSLTTIEKKRLLRGVIRYFYILPSFLFPSSYFIHFYLLFAFGLFVAITHRCAPSATSNHHQQLRPPSILQLSRRRRLLSFFRAQFKVNFRPIVNIWNLENRW